MTLMIKLQPATGPGHKQPYPYWIEAATGLVGRQDVWHGDPTQVVGVTDDPDSEEIAFTWAEVAADPECAVGTYMVVIDTDGMAAYQTPIDSVSTAEFHDPRLPATTRRA